MWNTVESFLTEAMARQTWNDVRAAPELVASIATEHDHTLPARTPRQWITVETDVGTGRLPVEATHSLRELPSEPIEEVNIVVHGILRNACDYFGYFKAALGEDYDSNRVLIAAPQFPASVDPVGHEGLRWGYSSWRGGEPAEAPCPPISSFDAMDVLVDHFACTLRNLKTLRLIGNSEGGQFVDRYLAFGRALGRIEQDGVTVEGVSSNPGTVLYFDDFRPVFNEAGDVQAWRKIPDDSPANQWPFGIHNPPPYIHDYSKNYDLRKAVADYLRRATLCVGTLDNDPQASQLPIGVGPDEQGSTRFQRTAGKYAHLLRYAALFGATNQTLPDAKSAFFSDTGHNAADIFRLMARAGFLASGTPAVEYQHL